MSEGNSSSVISIDFWDTLVVSEVGGTGRRNIRREAICDVSFSYVENLPDQEIDEAMRLATEKFNNIWRNEQRTPDTEELVNHILNYLGVPATQHELEYLITTFEESFWESPPELAEGVTEILPKLAGQHSLALISDTMYSPGRVIRTFLEDRGIKDLFDSFIFSDEQGYSKPDVKAFQTVLEETGSDAARSYHVGDLLETDIKGARQAGMNAILFTGVTGQKRSGDTGITPDYECEDWIEVRDILI